MYTYFEVILIQAAIIIEEINPYYIISLLYLNFHHSSTSDACKKNLGN